MRRYLLALTVLVAPLGAVRAQSAVADSGARIRVTTVDDPRAKNGSLVSLTPDTLVFHPGYLTTLIRTPLDSIRAIEKSRGFRRSSHSILVGAGIGGLVGLGAAAALLALPSGGDGPSPVLAAVAYAPLITAAGMVAGGLIGSEHRKEEWSQLYPDVSQASIIVGPAGHGDMAFGMSIPYDVPVSIEDVPSDSVSQTADP
jgi:hypothetical protein